MKAMRGLLRNTESLLASFAVQLLVGYDLRPMLEELRSALDDVPCSHCGLASHTELRSDADWLAVTK